MSVLSPVLSSVVLALLRLHLRVRGARPDRGDVPGWVLVTVMTAGLVTAIWAFAGPRLLEMLTTAINGVTGP